VSLLWKRIKKKKIIAWWILLVQYELLLRIRGGVKPLWLDYMSFNGVVARIGLLRIIKHLVA
jgi:hypothetical protein